MIENNGWFGFPSIPIDDKGLQHIFYALDTWGIKFSEIRKLERELIALLKQFDSMGLSGYIKDVPKEGVPMPHNGERFEIGLMTKDRMAMRCVFDFDDIVKNGVNEVYTRFADPFCGYQWVPRVEQPKRCPNPNCQKPLIDYPKPKKNQDKEKEADR